MKMPWGKCGGQEIDEITDKRCLHDIVTSHRLPKYAMQAARRLGYLEGLEEGRREAGEAKLIIMGDTYYGDMTNEQIKKHLENMFDCHGAEISD